MGERGLKAQRLVQDDSAGETEGQTPGLGLAGMGCVIEARGGRLLSSILGQINTSSVSSPRVTDGTGMHCAASGCLQMSRIELSPYTYLVSTLPTELL